MCLAAALDMHASAGRESLRASLRSALITPAESAASISARSGTPGTGQGGYAARHDSTARSGHIERTAPKRRKHVSPPSTGFRPYTRQEVKHLIQVHAAAYGIDADLPLAIAHCES